jgi:hypothetical protein
LAARACPTSQRDDGRDLARRCRVSCARRRHARPCKLTLSSLHPSWLLDRENRRTRPFLNRRADSFVDWARLEPKPY